MHESTPITLKPDTDQPTLTAADIFQSSANGIAGNSVAKIIHFTSSNTSKLTKIYHSCRLSLLTADMI